MERYLELVHHARVHVDAANQRYAASAVEQAEREGGASFFKSGEATLEHVGGAAWATPSCS